MIWLSQDMIPGFPMSGGYDSRPQGNRDNMLNSQSSLGLDVSIIICMKNLICLCTYRNRVSY